MLLLHQSGDVRVGEIVRYRLTYTPSLDRILPPPTHLHVKIKNTSAIPLRAAYLHGPYTLYVAGYPATFNSDAKFEHQEEEGTPDYEPQLKAGGSWFTKLKVPDEVRSGAEEAAVDEDGRRKKFTWIIEIASQVLFSTSAAVHYELLIGRDEKSVQSGLIGSVQVGSGHGMPGILEDVQKKRTSPVPTEQNKGVFSKAIRLVIDDTETLWNSPALPSFQDKPKGSTQALVDRSKHVTRQSKQHGDDSRLRKQKKVHLVILTHGLHSNLGADMLYMKESIDASAKKARADAKERRAKIRAEKAEQANEFGRDAANLKSKSVPDIALAAESLGVHDEEDTNDDDDDEEEVIVRGFNGNAVKTERGIQYLGKRLAKYVLSITYPDQPYLPVKSSISKSITRSLIGQKGDDDHGQVPIHKNSTIVKDDSKVDHNLAYRITSISFVGHSLGGLSQTYAIAYIQKHSPEFFDRIKPVNFIAMATPFLGLSNENPMYVKFALDFGLVGRTGQDLGLTWRAPTIARNSWGAMVNGLVNDPQKDREPDPGSKPLLRILPTGPAHQALQKFRNRTVYSNVVNDGIVPLRTSCLLFLDWRGLERVENARRGNGLVGTMVNWGWNEVTGQNATTARKALSWNDIFSDSGDNSSNAGDDPGSKVPQADASQDLDYDQRDAAVQGDGSITRPQSNYSNQSSIMRDDKQEQSANAWTAFLSYFKPQAGSKPRKEQPKAKKIYRRAQTMKFDDESTPTSPEKSPPPSRSPTSRKKPVRGASLYTNNSEGDNLEAPPKTTVFEAAGDLLNPPLPPREFILDPSARPRTIFHDRVYHPDDIPAPPRKRNKSFMKFNSSRNGSEDSSEVPNQAHSDLDRVSSTKPEGSEPGAMKIEEKIARAYHKNMSWRKVLVRLEPDAHNNMIVRRMFANAYGWPVVKHMCDTHFAFTDTAKTKDEDESTKERAKADNEAVGAQGEKVKGQNKPPKDETLEEHSNGQVRHRSVDGRLRTTLDVDQHSASAGRLKTLPTKLKQREQNSHLSRRSSSESRESRDEVSDLISMVNATGETSSGLSGMHSSINQGPNSASAALHRLARKDSARWSDRFFEGTDDDSSDEDDSYTRDLIEARERGEIADFSHLDHSFTNDLGTGSTDKPLEKVLTNSTHKIVQEPASMSANESLVDSANNETLPDPQTLSLSGIGLGSNAAEQLLATPGENKQRSNTRIAEQVAVAQGTTSSREGRKSQQ